MHTVLQVHRDHWKPTETLYFSSQHFLSDHMEKRGSYIRLKHGATPTLSLAHPVQLQLQGCPHLTRSAKAGESSYHVNEVKDEVLISKMKFKPPILFQQSP